MRYLAYTFAIVAAMSCARAAHAQARDRVQQATQLFEAARESMARGDVALACSQFDQSERLDPQLGTKLHLADCYEKQGKLASAWLQFRAAQVLAAERIAAGAIEPREKVAQLRAAKLKARLPTLLLKIRTRQPGQTIALDGRDLPGRAWGTAAPVDPGTHVLQVSAPGRVTWHESIEIAELEHLEVLVPDLPEERELKPSAPRSTQLTASDSTFEPQLIIAYALGGVGLVAGATGVALGIATENKVSKRDELCPRDLCRDQNEINQVGRLTREAQRSATMANVLMIGGAVALAAGVTLFVLAPHSSETKLSVAVHVSPYAAGLVLSGRGF
jgi:hypothetical protein